MSVMTLAPATTGNPDDSFNNGFRDGELAAATGLTERRLNARVSMAEQYDPMYAQGLADGYLHTTAVLAYTAREGRQ